MEGKIVVDTKTKNEENLVVRYPKRSDVKIMQDYINKLSEEQTFVSFQGEQISLEAEEDFLRSNLKRIKEKNDVLLLAFLNKSLIGISGINMKVRAEKHIGVLGISIAKEHRGEGIGKALMQTVLSEAEKNIADLKIITLSAFIDNDVAIRMYERFGFVEYGVLPNGVFRKGKYSDHVYMYKVIKGLI